MVITIVDSFQLIQRYENNQNNLSGLTLIIASENNIMSTLPPRRWHYHTFFLIGILLYI